MILENTQVHPLPKAENEVLQLKTAHLQYELPITH